MRLHRPVLAALALGTLLPVTAASAATGVAAAGSAVSSATIATVAMGGLVIGESTIEGHSISVGTLTTSAQTLTSAAPSVSFVPLTVDQEQIGGTTVTPANSPITVGGETASVPIDDLLAATSPAATLSAATGAAGPTSALTASLGSVKVMGLPINLNGHLVVGSSSGGSQAQAGKTLTITNISFPSLADLLAALHIDVMKLPYATLTSLVDDLPLDVGEETMAAYDDAVATADQATDDYNGYALAVTNTASALSAATTALDGELLDAVLTAIDFTGTGVSAPLDHNDWDTLTDFATVKNAIIALNTDLTALTLAYENAKTAADGALSDLSDAADDLDGAIGDVADIVGNILDGTALVSIGKAEVGTTAAVGSTKTAKVTGYVSGVKVMGLDLFDEVTGSSKLDLAKLVGDTAGDVNDTIGALTSTLSSILSSATGATGLVVPAPVIKFLTKSTSTGTDGAFGTADVAVDALSVSMGSVEVPREFALTPLVLDNAVTPRGVLPFVKTQPFSVKVGSLAESARFRPSTIPGTPQTPNTPGGGSELPATGGPYGLAVVAVIGAALAIGTRRHLRAATA
ncbi:MAG: hypothetical protein QOE45_2930 [Frankiaceae bacterium]|jgi:hypothetical protein|nr:hypothetical protein [Frankiaceae bacterium]